MSAASNTVSVVVEGADDNVVYYTINDGSAFSRAITAATSGVSTQAINSDC